MNEIKETTKEIKFETNFKMFMKICFISFAISFTGFNICRWLGASDRIKHFFKLYVIISSIPCGIVIILMIIGLIIYLKKEMKKNGN